MTWGRGMDAVQNLGFCGHQGTGQRAGDEPELERHPLFLNSTSSWPGCTGFCSQTKFILLQSSPVWDVVVCTVLPVDAL